MSNANNNNGTLFKWSLSTLLGITISLGSYAFNSVDTRLATVEQARIPTVERTAVLEAEVRALRGDVQRLETAIRELTARLDRGR